MSITILSAEVIDLIAAGEVIDSVLAVVRELVENALDAQATRISIELNLDTWQVQVVDNGAGMSLEDLRICARPHSTSKICNSQDLWQITSLGFRGEALHSISQVADLTIRSRLKDRLDTVGWLVSYQKGNPTKEEAIAIAPGTIITVSNIFGQLPVRRRSLPDNTAQLKAVQKLIQHIALCHPKVTWQVKQNGLIWFHLSAGRTAQQLLPQFLKKVSSSDFQYLKLAESNLDEEHSEYRETAPAIIELVLGLPDRLHRYRSDWSIVAINGRVVRCPELEQVIILGMSRTLPKDRFPVAFLHLQIDPAQVDWNRHPAKAEIYLHSIDHWQAKVNQAINQILKINSSSLPQAFSDRRIKQVIKVAEASENYDLGADSSDTKPTQKSSQEFSARSSNEIGSFELKAIAQVNKTYIVAEHSYGMWLIEQHIAHERILFEELQDRWQIIDLKTPINLSKLKDGQVEQLQQIGLKIEPFGQNLWTVRSAPEAIASRDDCSDALIELSWGGDLETAQVATACRTAIKNGTKLDLVTMQDILNRWQNTRNPRTCPHGRPIYLALEENSLARFFRRHWVIGKSHGI